MNTNKDGIVKQSGNDVECYPSQMVLFKPNVHVFLQHSVKGLWQYDAQERERFSIEMP